MVPSPCRTFWFRIPLKLFEGPNLVFWFGIQAAMYYHSPQGRPKVRPCCPDGLYLFTGILWVSYSSEHDIQFQQLDERRRRC